MYFRTFSATLITVALLSLTLLVATEKVGGQDQKQQSLPTLKRSDEKVVTDGFPVGDAVAPQTVIERANAAEVSIFTITLPSFSPALAKADVTPLPTPLDVSGLVQQTGGVSVYTTDEDFAPLLHALAAEVTSSYVLAFYPTDEKRRDGRFHTIHVKAPPGFTIRQNRPGYHGDLR